MYSLHSITITFVNFKKKYLQIKARFEKIVAKIYLFILFIVVWIV